LALCAPDHIGIANTSHILKTVTLEGVLQYHQTIGKKIAQSQLMMMIIKKCGFFGSDWVWHLRVCSCKHRRHFCADGIFLRPELQSPPFHSSSTVSLYHTKLFMVFLIVVLHVYTYTQMWRYVSLPKHGSILDPIPPFFL
jgi:hypothetical protein